MKKLLLSFVLFSFSSFGQEIESKEIFRDGNTTIRLNNTSGEYRVTSRNNKYVTLWDIKVYSFSNKTELVAFLDSLDKFTSISNYKPEFERAMLSSTMGSRKYKFTIHNNNLNLYTNELKKSENNDDSLELVIFVKNGWIKFTNKLVKQMKLAVN